MVGQSHYSHEQTIGKSRTIPFIRRAGKGNEKRDVNWTAVNHGVLTAVQVRALSLKTFKLSWNDKPFSLGPYKS